MTLKIAVVHYHLRPGGVTRVIEHALAAVSDHDIHQRLIDPALLGRILNAYDRFVENDYAESFIEMWERFDLLRDNPITVVQSDELFSGIARGIDSQGALRLELEDGSVLPFLAGDATLDKSGRR